MNDRIVVTGISGYIGGQTALILKDNGYEVYGIDCRPLPDHLSEFNNNFLLQDFSTDTALSWIAHKQPHAVIHCAGTSLVGPSVKSPREYYQNNVFKTTLLLDYMLEHLGDTRFVFSSSAAVYGVPLLTPCQEVDPCDPISPYGESKRMVEQIMSSYNRAYNFDYVALRYFNACGADSKGRHGQEPGATHIIARLLESLRDDQPFVLYGTNYQTKDGTCVRDYVHVEDIAWAHMLAVTTNIPAGIYNLGSTQGTSNREIIAAAQAITKKQPVLIEGIPRDGDPDILTASDEKFASFVGNWRRWPSVNDMIAHAWAWYTK